MRDCLAEPSTVISIVVIAVATGIIAFVMLFYV